MDKLLNARNEIDSIDAQMAELFCRRMKASAEVAKYKQENGLAVFDAKREEEVINKTCELMEKRISIDPMRHLATASCFWDATPRYSQHWIDMGYTFHHTKKWYLSPENFRRVLERMKATIDKLPEEAYARKIFMIDNWNEWDEGHFVSPSHQFGFKYLQAIREVFTERNNLPDYRTPSDMGLVNYNKSWDVPDFKEICKKRLK